MIKVHGALCERKRCQDLYGREVWNDYWVDTVVFGDKLEMLEVEGKTVYRDWVSLINQMCIFLTRFGQNK